jgi:hypothetical protein
MESAQSGARLQSVIAGLVGRPWFWIIAVAIPFSWPIYLAMTNRTPAAIPIVGTLAEFSVKDQQGHVFGKDELERRAWVMNLAALDDPAVEGSTAALEKVQYRGRNLGQTFGIVTWVIDGDGAVDRVAGYVKKRPISPRIWWFVPSTPPAVADSFEEAIAKGVGGPLSETDRKKLVSGNTLFLVDSMSRLRGIYDASDEESVDRLLHDAGLLINRGY